MPKMRTKKALQSRFKVTGTGKLRRNKAGRRHILTKKTSKRKRQLRLPEILDETVARKYRLLMPKGV